MRVALFAETFLPDVNGVVTTLRHVLEQLRVAGHDALLFAPVGAPAHYAGTTILPLPGVPFPLYPDLRLTLPLCGIIGPLRRFRPDLIHLAGPFMLGPTVRVVARRLGLPVVASYHTDVPKYAACYGLGRLRGMAYRYLRWVHNGCALTLCPSTATLDDLCDHGFERLHIWRRGVDTSHFHPDRRSAAWRREVGAAPSEAVLLYVGRLAHEKRIGLLADALGGLEGVRLVLIGDGPARTALQRQFAGLPAYFCGMLHGDDLAQAYASADVFVCPSDTETFGQATQEAMASGLPVIGARAGGTLDLVRQGVSGLLFRPGDARDLRDCIWRLVAAPVQRLAMRDAARALAEQRSWRTVVAELVGWYDSCVGCSVPPSE